METIKRYLESMFENLPRTLEVMRAKEELYSMMEDKYTELINEGKKENEAISIVISEFGNLDELAENLGINKSIFEAASSDRRYVSQQEADDYIYAVIARRLFLALGIMLCIFSPAGPILFDPISDFLHFPGIEGLGVGLMFLCAAVGVGLIIFSSFMTKSWRFIDKEPCILDNETIDYIAREKDESQTGRGVLLTAGIMLCIVSVVPVIVLSTAFSSMPMLSDGIGPSMIFTLAGIGVFLIVFSSAKSSACRKLLSLNTKKFPFGYRNNTREYNENENNIEYVQGEEIAPERANNKVERTVTTYSSSDRPAESRTKDFLRQMVMSYWKSVTCIYFIWSFLTMNWGSSWLIFPVAGLLRGPIERYFGVNK
jgi:hypothetical protein